MPGNQSGSTVNFDDALHRAGLSALTRAAPSWLQLNLGRKCNQACRHCHVDASPARTEMMSEAHIDRVIELLEQNPSLTLVDVTGGAPEMHPSFQG